MITVLILTRDEERHIERAIRSVKPFAERIVVIDSFSADRTVEIALAAGAEVLQHGFTSHARQFEWGVTQAGIRTEWLMRLDADEVIGAELAEEICETLPAMAADVSGIALKRKQIFLGRWIRHGGRYPLVLTRIWRHGRGRVEDRWMDEHVVIDGGRIVCLQQPFADHNLNDLGFFVEKHNRYATREAVEVLSRRYGLFRRDIRGRQDHTAPGVARKRWIKERVYDRMPFPLAALGYFLFRYVVQLGFLDGREGLIYHGLQGFWYRFLVGAKAFEWERALRRHETAEDKRKELARLTGLSL